MRTLNLGDKVIDEVSGFDGIITCYTEYLYGSDMVLVSPARIQADGELIDDGSFYVEQLTLVKRPNSD